MKKTECALEFWKSRYYNKKRKISYKRTEEFKMDKKNIDWSSLGFGYLPTDKR